MVEQVPPHQTDPEPAPAPAAGDAFDAQLAVLRLLAETPDLSQRALSARLGLSLGKAHYILHALLDKGQVKVRNFRRSDRKLAYAYVLTPSGLSEKLRLTKRFLSHKEAEFEALKQTIDALRSELEEDRPRRPTRNPGGAGER